MSGYRLRDPAALLAALVVPFLAAPALTPLRTDLPATNAALVLVVTAALLLVVGLIVVQSAVRGRRLRSAVATGAAHLPSPRGSARLAEYADWPDGETELRVVGGGHYYGRYLLDPRPGRRLPAEQDRLVAVALAAQAGAALDTAGLSAGHQ
ncbi:hypothetical protein ABZ667_31415 [Streptomyces lavendulae]|uniref:hypothetical protein n=1 Tax=Streptomyces lavendulae TaxID=1914 RepID=UPI0033E7C6F4